MYEVAEDRFSWRFALFLCFTVCALYYFQIVAKARVDLEIEVNQRTWFKLYYAEENQPFAEKRMAKIRLKPGQKNYSFYLTNLRHVGQLRIDTHEYKGRALLKSLDISQKGFAPISFNAPEQFQTLKPHFQIESYSFDDDGLEVNSTGIDPNFTFDLNSLERAPFGYAEEFFRALSLCFLVVVLYATCRGLKRGYNYVPILLALAALLAATMATISKENAHPDEFVHVAAVQYYTENWLPPQVEDDRIEHSYSPYGVSRLHGKELYYLLAGKVALLLQPFYQNSYSASRGLNVLLLVAILLYTARVSGARVMAIPLLISPQLWYLFSYCNSDGFAVAVTFFAGCQVVLPDSTLNRFLRDDPDVSWIARGVVAGLLLGPLFLLKNNYLPYLVFLFLVMVLYVLREPSGEGRRQLMIRTVVVIAISLSLLAGKKIADYTVNGPDREARIAAVKAEQAEQMYKPGTTLDHKHPNLSLKERGVELKTVILVYRWFEKTYRSAFGVYGYMEISSSDIYYDLLRWSAVLFFIFFFAVLLLRGDPVAMISSVLALTLAGALIGASLHHSWVADFQPQGRYLFPIVGMLVILCGQGRDCFPQRWMALLTSWMFALSLYSFVSFGLLHIARIAIT